MFKLVQHGCHCTGTPQPDMFKLVQHGPHCTGPSPQTHSNLFNMDLTVQGPPPRHIQICSTWTSLYRALPQDTLKLVQHGPHCTGPSPQTHSKLFNMDLTVQGPPPPTCSNLFNMDLTVQPSPNTSKLVQFDLTVQGPPPRHVQICSLWSMDCQKSGKWVAYSAQFESNSDLILYLCE